MLNVLWLATEASAENGFGLNLNLLDTNLINLGILIVVPVRKSCIGSIIIEEFLNANTHQYFTVP